MPKERKTTKKKEVKEPKPEGEKVCEIFEVKKEEGREKIVESCGTEEPKAASDVQRKKENKIFKIIIITLIGFILMFLVVVWAVNYFNQINVGGVIFEMDKTTMTGKILYKTSIPVSYKDGTTGKVISADYNFYFRTDPRILEKVPFQGKINLRDNMVINMTEDFNCDGYGIIAVANILKLYEVIGVKVIKDEDATCDELYGRYMYLNLKGGEETFVNTYGIQETCQNIYINDCEILEGTERFMLETLIEVNKNLDKKRD
ncbi:MAG: hypothetical protein PHQ66_03510 [Candidatus Nanoarchaeia archaeon]|nr:hypothetical protein [Candidatus Nanoarchaeia archaeon]MDD5357570.1 hypothetical protein [Candidatus Nanoarchaeia archaeon]MDD5588489.1 hypothetical protein [Candidatus Nanoarchaeia archaeon]